jgi:hypothetical protein
MQAEGESAGTYADVIPVVDLDLQHLVRGEVDLFGVIVVVQPGLDLGVDHAEVDDVRDGQLVRLLLMARLERLARNTCLISLITLSRPVRQTTEPPAPL